MGKIRVIKLMVGVLVLALMAAPALAADVKQISMGTATVGGIFYHIGSPLAQCVNKALPEVNITAEFTQGSTENLRLLDQGKMEMAIITPQIGAFARTGAAMFKGKKMDFRVVARLLPNANVWAVLDKSKVQNFADMKGRKVAVGPASGGLGAIARAQLAANGIDYKKDIKPMFMGAGDMAEALKDGAVEASFLTAELAHLVASTHKIRILGWSEDKLKSFLEKNPNYGEYTYPADNFKGVNYPVTSVDNGIQLICRTDMDEGLIYNITKAILDNLGCMSKIYAPAKAMTKEWAALELGNPYHPGAVKYYQEIGVWKD